MTNQVRAEQVQIGDVSEGCVAQAVEWDGDDVVVIEWADAKGGRATLRYNPAAFVKVEVK